MRSKKKKKDQKRERQKKDGKKDRRGGKTCKEKGEMVERREDKLLPDANVVRNGDYGGSKRLKTQFEFQGQEHTHVCPSIAPWDQRKKIIPRKSGCLFTNVMTSF